MKSTLLALLLSLASTATFAADLTSGVSRINGKRHKKIVSGDVVLYVPSLGLPFAGSLAEAKCAASLAATDEVIEISKPGPADDEVKSAEKDVRAALKACPSPAKVQADAKAAKKDDGCDSSSSEPVLGADGKVKGGSGTIGVGCKKKID